MNIILMGAQGSGKSSQAQLLAKEFNLAVLSTGEAFRSISREKSPLAVKVRKIMKSGRLVDDETVMAVVKKTLTQPKFEKGVIIEGFPRNLEQTENLGLKIDRVFYLSLSREESIRRLTSRRICRECATNFNLLTEPPKEKGKCDKCGGALYQREDDTQGAVNKRLDIFEQQTRPVLDFYREKGLLEAVDGRPSIPEIFEDLKKRIKSL